MHDHDEDPFLEDLRGWSPRGLYPGGGGFPPPPPGGGHHGFPPPPPPPPPGEHRGSRGFGGGPRRRVFAPGDLRLLILSLMEAQPRHGYEIIKAIEELFQGAYAPSPGAVYPILTYLQDQDFIREEVEGRGGKRLYSSTEAGRAHLEDNRIVLEGILTRVGITAHNLAPQGPPEAVMQALHTLRHAIAVRRSGWTPADALRISKVILSAAKDIATRDGEGSNATS